MDSINRLNSPMALYVEDLTEHPLELERRREIAQKAVRESPASFLVGSMESVSQKVVHLEQQLKNFCTDDLENESPGIYGTLPHAGCFSPWYKEQRVQFDKKCKEYDKKELQKCTHMYKRSMTKTDFAEYPKTKGSTTKEIKPKPKLVELYQFSGFSYQDPLPLPHEISPRTIIEKVVSAHKNTGAKICPTREVYRFLITPVAQKILLDCYWWFFLHRYKADTEIQNKLFGRVAENYIQLLTLCQSSYHGDAFLKVFPSVLSQAIYCSFCFSFPHSLHQFQSNDFKAQLCSVFWQWIGGICPMSGVYITWDYLTLEPKDDTTDGKVKQKKGTGSSWFGLSNAGEHNGFSTSLSFRPRMYSVYKTSRKNSSAVIQPSVYKKHSVISFSNQHLQCLPGSKARDVGKLKTGVQSSKGTTAKESHPSCHRPNFIHMLFDLSGHSPLVQYYLEKKKADSQANVSVLVHRTEIWKQTPTSSVTRDEVIKQ